MRARILSPDGRFEFATAPDETWAVAVGNWPKVGELVEACWSSRIRTPAEYRYDKVRLRSEYMDGRHNMSEWENERGAALRSTPDFWRPLQTSEGKS